MKFLGKLALSVIRATGIGAVGYLLGSYSIFNTLTENSQKSEDLYKEIMKLKKVREILEAKDEEERKEEEKEKDFETI